MTSNVHQYAGFKMEILARHKLISRGERWDPAKPGLFQSSAGATVGVTLALSTYLPSVSCGGLTAQGVPRDWDTLARTVDKNVCKNLECMVVLPWCSHSTLQPKRKVFSLLRYLAWLLINCKNTIWGRNFQQVYPQMATLGRRYSGADRLCSTKDLRLLFHEVRTQK